MKVKICGITNLADARYCAAAGADYLGFIQYPESPRYIKPDLARQIIEWMYGPEAVGVFVNEPADTVNRVADQAGFAIVQLHGAELPDVCAQIERPVIKAIRVAPEATPEQLHGLMERYQEHVDYFLLDTHKVGLWGGTGTTFDWQVARDLAATFPLFLAGGLHADNVAEAVRTVHPYGIDLSSSVETEPGQKDFDKLAAFFEVYHALNEPQNDES